MLSIFYMERIQLDVLIFHSIWIACPNHCRDPIQYGEFELELDAVDERSLAV